MTETTKVAIVTGAGSGIGKAVAAALLKTGYHVVLAGRRQTLLETAVSEADATAANALVVATDVANPESVRKLFARTKA
jgi:NADP-dependent 3-hydroxy acid dehydrogenase YdfG